jgi:cysteinyl-tRNA synthetase
MFQLYNTLTRQKEPFQSIEPNKVKLYVCGPTVYGSAHIGHGMSYIVFDTLRRYLEYKGYEVAHVQNFTDVDDRIINKANETGEAWNIVSRRYIDEFLAEMDTLNVQRATRYILASEVIGEIIEMIQGLLDKGFAYVLGDDVYFRVKQDDDYGKLSNRQLDNQKAGARIEVDAGKEHPADFALWKGAKPGEPSWESPWGAGRPGWHIECSAMNLLCLGAQIDIHGGGHDLIFPHHENEIAQSESYTGHEPFARYWVHNGLLQLGDEKMSRSVGNLVRINDLLKRVSLNGWRYFVLSSHYRRPLTYTEKAVLAAESATTRLMVALRPTPLTKEIEADTMLRRAAENAMRDFEAAMDDDLNTPVALSVLVTLAKELNTARTNEQTGPGFVEAQNALRKLMGVLGMATEFKQAEIENIPYVEEMITKRAKLRESRNYREADQIRDELKTRGIMLEDDVHGTTWRVERG